MNIVDAESQVPSIQQAVATVTSDGPDTLAYKEETTKIASEATGTELQILETNDVNESLVKIDAQALNQQALNDAMIEAMENGDIDSVRAFQSLEPIPVAIEELAADAIVDDSTNESSNDFNNLSPGFRDAYRISAANDMIYDKWSTKWTEQAREQGLVDDTIDFVSGLVPLWETVATRNALDDFSNAILPGSTFKEVYSKFQTMSPTQKDAFLDKVDQHFQTSSIVDNPSLKMGILAKLMNFTSEKGIEENVWAAADVADVLPWGMAGKALKSAARANKFGNRTKAAKETSQILHSTQPVGPQAAYEAAKEAIPSIASTGGKGASVGEKARWIYEEELIGEAAQRATQLVNPVKALSDTERASLAVQTVDEIAQGLPAQVKLTKTQQPIDISLSPTIVENRLSSSLTARIKIGTGLDAGQTGFTSIINARTAAKRMGLTDYNIEQIGGQFFLNIEQAIKNESLEDWFNAPVRSIGKLDPRSADIIVGGRFSEKAHLFIDSREEAVAFIDTYAKDIRKLKTKDREHWNSIVEKGIENQEWYSHESLRNKGFNESQIKAYDAYRNLEDLAWSFDNALMWHNMNQKGMKTLSIKSAFAKEKGIDAIDAIPVDNINNPYKLNFYNASTGKAMNKVNKETLDAMLNQGYRIFRMNSDEKAFEASATQYLLVKNKEVNVNPLRSRVLPYIAGGRRRYSGNHFIKQGRTGTTSEGVGFVKRSKTLAVTQTAKEANEFAEAMNNALTAYKQADEGIITRSDATRVIQTNMSKWNNIASFEDVKRLLDEGTLNLHDKVEAVQDGGVLSGVRDFVNKNSGNLLFNKEDLVEADSIQRMIYEGGSNRSGRGQHLHDLNGQRAPLLDPTGSVQKTLNQASYNITAAQFKDRAVTDWFTKYKSVLEPSQVRTPHGHFANPNYIKPANADQRRVVNEAIATKAVVDRLLGTPTPGEEALQNLMRRAGDFVDGRRVPLLNSKKISDFKPAEFLKSFAFNAYLGMLNIGQIILQSSALVNASALMGVHRAPKAVGGAMLMRAALLKSDSSTLDFIASKAALMGWDKSEFKTIFNDLKNSHKMSMKQSITDVDFAANSISGGKIKRVLDWGQTPFMKIESFNRTVSFIGARLKWSADTGKKAMISEADRGAVSLMADTFAGSMTKASASNWQKGIVSVPTQFMGYMARVFEMLLWEKLGGSQNINGFQRTALWTALVSTWGIDGLAGEGTGEQLTKHAEWMPAEMKRVIQDGWLDSALFSLIGSETNFNERMGPTFRNNLIADILSEESSAVELMFGPSGQLIGKTYGGVAEWVSRSLNVLSSPQYTTADAFVTALEGLDPTIIKSWSDLRKAEFALRTGHYLDSRGDVVLSNLNTFESVMIGMGFKPQSIADVYLNQTLVRDEENRINEAVKDLKPYVNKWIRGEDGMTDDKLQRYIDAVQMEFIDNPISAGKVLTRVWRQSMLNKSEQASIRFFETFGETKLGKEREQF